MLSPYAPHICEELWQRLGEGELIAHARWPVHDAALCLDDMVTIVIQVNDKKRDELSVPKDADNASLERLALSSDRVANLLEGRSPRRVIVVAGRLVNLVI